MKDMTARPPDDRPPLNVFNGEDPNPIPLSLLVAEGVADSVDVLAARLDGAVELDDVGIRCVSRQTARWLLAEKAEAEAQLQAHRQRQQDELTRRCGEVHAAVLPGVPLPQGLEGVPALAAMSAGRASERRDEAGSRHDEYASGASYYHPIQEGP